MVFLWHIPLRTHPGWISYSCQKSDYKYKKVNTILMTKLKSVTREVRETLCNVAVKSIKRKGVVKQGPCTF